jgi:hypothetical protein
VWCNGSAEHLSRTDPEREKQMPPPKEMDTVLREVPLRIGVSVPDDLIEDWFAPGTGMNPPSQEALTAAASYGWSFECEFKHEAERKEGVFWKWVPAI